jgi:hypothetical protein
MRNSYFLIVVPHICWVRIFTLRALSPPLQKGKGAMTPLRPPFRRPCRWDLKRGE